MITSSTNHQPPVAKGHYLWGHLFNIQKEGIHFYERMFQENGETFRVRVLHKTYYVFLNPDHNREILSEKPDVFIKGAQYNSLRLILGNGLLTSEGKKWAKQRKTLNPVFGKEGMDLLLPHINRITQEHVRQLPIGEEINWTKSMFDYTLNVAIASFFGTLSDKQEVDRFASSSMECIRFVSRRMTNFFNLPLTIPTKEHRQFKKSFLYLKRFVESIYNERIKNSAPPRDLLDLLMTAQDENQQQLSKEEVWDQILSFMIAGHETTASTMSWLFYLLAKHPEVQEKIAEECQKNNFEFNNSLSLNQYPYLMAVLNETMRLYPAGWIISRDIAADATVGSFMVKKGRVLAVSPYITQRDPRWWKNPSDFVPERFLDNHPDSHTAPKNSFIPFSLGRRNCIGARFALLEMALFLIHFVKDRRAASNQGIVGVKGFVTLKSDQSIKITTNLHS